MLESGPDRDVLVDYLSHRMLEDCANERLARLLVKMTIEVGRQRWYMTRFGFASLVRWIPVHAMRMVLMNIGGLACSVADISSILELVAELWLHV